MEQEKGKLVRIISSTNPNVDKFIGQQRRYLENFGCGFLEELDNKGNGKGIGIRTSKIVDIIEEKEMMRIQTKNSVYVLEKVEESI